ncbi:MAG: CDP-diacylglycerol--serine O-phosphatidyltransferase [Candidatus Brocadiae bacterium]|nr:CDP-diacylglycerol--serine O-phosphatidyltransferase [Candidatus Brocadiia bacterium]
MKKISIKILPSIITLGNLFCGFLAIAYIAENKITAAAWLIFAGMVFDVFDGKVARLTKNSSDFGMQLDSLSDMISFGVAPAFLAKVYILQTPAACPARMAWIICLLYVMCTALRLARFNVETDHDESAHLYFKGLASPGAAGVIASLVLCSEIITTIIPVFYFKIALLSVTFFLGALMVSQVRYIHFGIQFLKKRRPVTHLVGVIFFLALIAIEPQIFVLSLTSGFCLYAFLVPIQNLWKKQAIQHEAILCGEAFVEAEA